MPLTYPRLSMAFFVLMLTLALSSCGGSGTTVGPAPAGGSGTGSGSSNPTQTPHPTASATPGTRATATPQSSSSPAAPAQPPSGAVQTTSGTFVGSQSNGVAQFLGIPYAAPPVGPLRWKPPQPVVAKSGVQSATAFGKACEQGVSPTSNVLLSPPASDQSEDCLYLNIYAPSGLSGKKPVDVWLYGGAYFVGYADPYSGVPFAQKGIVFVNLNYRLGIFGFFPHPGLDTENSYHASGNQGLLDQVAALQWVKNNIAAFGGDPNNVTIEGESAGAGSVGSLLTSPLGKGLFHRTILESTYALWHPQYTLAQAEANFATNFPLYGDSIATLRSLPAATILAAAPQDQILGNESTNLYDPTNYGPIVDNHYQTDSSLHLWRNHQFSVNDMLIGTCDNEGYIFTSEPVFGTGYPQYETNPTFQSYLASQYGGLASQALADYPVSAPTDASLQLGYAFGDTWFGYGTRQVARAESASGATVYRYVFSRTPSGSTSPETHGCEVNFVFPGAVINTTPTDSGAATYTSLFQDTVARFVLTGNPNGGTVTNWPAFGSSDAYLEIGNNGNVPSSQYRQAPLDLVDTYSKANLP